jgi:uncharacterized protein (DUF1697 family)
MKYIALLRGINVGGNNKVSMAELKACFEAVGHSNVLTYINSGNVVFESNITDKVELVRRCESAIENQFGFKIVCAVLTAQELEVAMAHAPSWWGVGDAKHNALFVIAPKTTKDIIQSVGEEKPEYEKIAAYDPILFWSAPLETFSKTRYSKIVGTDAYQYVTIRNSNTTKKLLELSRK